MKVLLINPGMTEQNKTKSLIKRRVPFSAKIKKHAPLLPGFLLKPFLSGFGSSEKRFPIGLGYLSSKLKQQGHCVYLIDRYAKPGEWCRNIHSYDFVCIYTSTPGFDDALQVVSKIEQSGYKNKIAVGGPHASLFPETIPDRVDYVVQGEGEYVINELAAAEFDSGTIIRTPRIQDLDQLPRPDYDLFLQTGRDYQYTFDFSKAYPVFNMNTSRGCPYNCAFCSVRDVWGRLWIANSADRVMEDLAHLTEKYGIGGVYFREDLFSAGKKRVEDLCDKIIQREVNILWACETRADMACDEELVRRMAEAGCIGFFIGAESGSAHMLEVFNKGITVDKIELACSMAKKYGIRIGMSLIVGHPEETVKDKFATWKLLRRTKPEILYVNLYRDEYTRHGNVGYEKYPPRKVMYVSCENGTWRGQKDRKTTFSRQEAL